MNEKINWWLIAALIILLTEMVCGILLAHERLVKQPQQELCLTTTEGSECCCAPAVNPYDGKVHGWNEDVGPYLCTCDAESFVEIWDYLNCYNHIRLPNEPAAYECWP